LDGVILVLEAEPLIALDVQAALECADRRQAALLASMRGRVGGTMPVSPTRLRILSNEGDKHNNSY
jgi:hypothetical protein